MRYIINVIRVYRIKFNSLYNNRNSVLFKYTNKSDFT